MQLSYSNILDSVSKYFPEFIKSDAYKYLVDNHSSDLPYVVMGVFADYYLGSLEKGDGDLLKRITDFIEDCSTSGDLKLQELICFGFLENIIYSTVHYEEKVKHFGIQTKSLIKDTRDMHARLA